MDNKDRKERFYIYAPNAIGRISIGDSIIVDRKCEITPGSIALTFPYFTLKKVECNSTECFIGRVVRIIIEQ